MRDKVSFAKLEELKDDVQNLQANNLSIEDSLTQKLTVLKDDLETKTKEMMDNIEDLNKKMDELSEEDGSEYDEESDQDLDSELGDTLDVNDMNRTVLEKARGGTPDESPTSPKRNQGPKVAKKANSGGSDANDAD